METLKTNNMKRFWVRKIAMIIIFSIAALFLFSGIVMYLWNALLPAILGVKAITLGQALGILLLSKILFGGFGHRRWGGRQRWGRNMQDKWSTMSPEEREKFKSEWKSRCGNRWRRNEQEPGMAE